MADQSDELPRDLASTDVTTTTTRRRFLALAATVSTAVGAAGYARARQGNLIELGAVASGWEGRTPEAIEGKTNPGLTLEAGQDYEVAWENVDGLPHNFVIENADSGQAIRTERVSRAGAIQTVTFTATRDMAGYYCEVHPDSMAGNVKVTGTAPTPTATPGTPDVAGKEFATTLAGSKVVPPVETAASGEAAFTVEQRGDGMAVLYQLAVSGPWRGCITEAHLHLGDSDENGPVVAVLFDALDPVVDAEGTLAEAIIPADGLAGPLANEDLATLVERMAAGEAYVDVHTTAYPTGEIRGQIEPADGP